MTLYAVIDFETTGLDPQNDYPIQLGWQMVEDNGKEVFMPEGSKAVYIKPDMDEREYLNTRAYLVHGIPYHALTTQPGSASKSYKSFLADVTKLSIHGRKVVPVIAGHNAFFDFAFLKRLRDLASAENFPFDYHLMDTATLGMFFYGSKALDSLVRLAGINYNWHKRHDAGLDVRITAELLMHFLKLKKILLY